jgi:hypothetical protein
MDLHFFYGIPNVVFVARKTATESKGKMTKVELEALIATAYAQRKQAYKIRAPRILISAINHQLRELNAKLAEVNA